MPRMEAPPFERGETKYGPTATIDTADPNYLSDSNLEGKEWEFEDTVPASSNGPKYPRTLRSGKQVRVRIVRNASTINLVPKRMVKMQTGGTDGKFYLGRVDGYVNATAERGYPVDEFLPSAGVRPNDLFYVVVDGPAVVQTDVNTLSATINVGDQVVAGTFASSTNTTGGGGVQPFSIDAGTTANSSNANQIRNALGRALSAKTANNTAADILVDIGHW